MTCAICRFAWDRAPGGTLTPEFLQCVRHAPAPVAYNGDQQRPDDLGENWSFPRVFSNYRCGEFEAKS